MSEDNKFVEQKMGPLDVGKRGFVKNRKSNHFRKATEWSGAYHEEMDIDWAVDCWRSPAFDRSCLWRRLDSFMD